MLKRRQAREIALQVLFYMDIRQDFRTEILLNFCDNFLFDDTPREFFTNLVNGILERRSKLDARIIAASKNWRLERMSVVDRNAMRIAVYEMLYCDDIPPVVSINEAIEIVKKFGSDDSGAFINGILNTIWKQIEAEPAQEGSDTDEDN